MNCKNITSLSAREMEVLKLIGEGWSSLEIGARTGLMHSTISTHRKNILRKTGARNIVSVIIVAVQERLIRIDNIAA